MLTGAIYLIDKWLPLQSLGMGWMVHKDIILLYAAAAFLWFKSDKSVGLILAGIWLIQNTSLVVSLLGQLSTFLLPAVLLLAGCLLYWFTNK